MGGCSSTVDEEEQLAIENTKKIDKANAAEYQRNAEKIKVLLLGAGDSGKSTIFKQMRLLYGTPYTDEEKMSFRIFIAHDCVETIEQLCLATKAAFPEDPMIHSTSFQMLCPLDSPSDQYRKFPEFTEEYVRAIRDVWRSPLMEEVWLRRSSLQISDTSALFLDRIDEISSPQYQPSESDIIFARIRTTGIREDNLQIDDQIFQFFDVGGQRNERRKWINCFEGVHGVMFVAALSEFDQTLFEENSVNRMVEALDLFQQTVNETAFVKSAMILFLNKSDLYDEKIKRVHIASIPAFSDYAGPAHDRDAGIAYFVNKFMQRNETHQEIFHHVTCATDQSSIVVVFNACKSVIIRLTLENTGGKIFAEGPHKGKHVMEVNVTYIDARHGLYVGGYSGQKTLEDNYILLTTQASIPQMRLVDCITTTSLLLDEPVLDVVRLITSEDIPADIEFVIDYGEDYIPK